MMCSGNNRGMSQKRQLIDRVYKRHATRIFHVNLTVSCCSPVWITKNLSSVISKFVAFRIQWKHILETPFIWQIFYKLTFNQCSMSICPWLLGFISTVSLLQSIIIMPYHVSRVLAVVNMDAAVVYHCFCLFVTYIPSFCQRHRRIAPQSTLHIYGYMFFLKVPCTQT